MIELLLEEARAAPQAPWARIVEAAALLASRDRREFEAAGWIYAALSKTPLERMEREHLRAIGVALDGDFSGAADIYDEILQADPRDALALSVAQVFDYYLGRPQALLARTTRALAAWPRATPRYPALLSLHAYALQECGAYDEAERTALRALALNPRDARAHHALAHVMEMQGRFEEGLGRLGARAALWAGRGATSTHLWWHLALYHFELGRTATALALHDARIQHGEALSELIDASALLWRLHLAGVPLGSRFARLAGRWAPYAEDAHCAFNDLHAMMAFVGAGRRDCAERLLAAQERRASRPGSTNYDMTRLVGLPASRALAAFGRGDFATAERLLRALPPVAHRIGGSHAQRDVLQLTRAAARNQWGQISISLRNAA